MFAVLLNLECFNQLLLYGSHDALKLLCGANIGIFLVSIICEMWWLLRAYNYWLLFGLENGVVFFIDVRVWSYFAKLL